MRWVRGASTAILVAVLATACGGADDDTSAAAAKGGAGDEAAATSTTAAGAGENRAPSGSKGSKQEAGATTTVPGGSASAARDASGAPAASGGAASEPDGSELPSEPLPLTVELSSTCVRPGTRLTVTVKTAPKAQLGYDTTWADGKTGWDAPNRGGTAKGAADDEGTWKHTATIGADTPKGTAKMDVIGTDLTGRMGRETVEYQVSDALGKCA